MNDLGSLTDEQLVGARRAVEALGGGVDEIDASAVEVRSVADAGERGFFRPDEEDRLLGWFARFLTVRSGLWEVLDDISGWVGGDPRRHPRQLPIRRLTNNRTTRAASRRTRWLFCQGNGAKAQRRTGAQERALCREFQDAGPWLDRGRWTRWA